MNMLYNVLIMFDGNQVSAETLQYERHSRLPDLLTPTEIQLLLTDRDFDSTGKLELSSVLKLDILTCTMASFRRL